MAYKVRRLQATKRLLQAFWNYRIRKKEKVGYLPYRLWIEPTNRCNLQCIMCPNKDLEEKDLGFMDFALFKKIIDEAKDFVYDINLHHRGEATLHPRLIEMVQYAKGKGVLVKLHTNGTTLTEKMSRSLIESGLDLLSFSFDGYTAGVYERIRIGANFEKTLHNILRFLEIKRNLNRSKPKTVMEVMELEDFPYCQIDKENFLTKFKSSPFDKLIVKRPHNWAGNISMGTSSSDGLVPCTFPWHGLVILWDGKVGPCPHDFKGEIILGDARQHSLGEIFNSPAALNLRRQMIQLCIEEISPCNRCDSVRRRNIFGIPISSLKYLKE